MNERTALDHLALQNPWWDDKKDFPFHSVFTFKRSDYRYLVKSHLNIEEATVVTGSRGVGKSTVLLEIIRELLGFPKTIPKKGENIPEPSPEGVAGSRIIYLSFDQANFQRMKIIDILRIYAKYVLGKDISKLQEKTYVFLDEVQNVEDWGTQIKALQDLKYPIKIFISGSSSVAMINEASKATRRVFLYTMHPLKFSDYLRYHIKDDKFEKLLVSLKDSREEFLKSHKKGDGQKIYEYFLKAYNDLRKWRTEIELLFEDYSIKGGYPGLLDESDLRVCSQKLRQTFLLGFHKDLVLAKGVRDPVGMKNLAYYLAATSSCETNYTQLMKNSKVTTNTEILKKYLYHFKQAFLTNTSLRLGGKVSKRGNAFKVYLNDIAIRNMLLGLMNKLLIKDEKQYGYGIETLVFDHLIRLHHKLNPGSDLYYWKNPKTDQEVDIVCKLNGHEIPFEVKKADSPGKSDVEGLVDFCDGKIVGITLCGKRLSIHENIVYLPHWLFILIC